MTTPVCDDDVEELLRATAVHEAGHAVMRWHVGFPLTELSAGYGEGLCGGTGRRFCIIDNLKVALAGYAAETGYGLGGLVLAKCRASDLDEARSMLRDGPEWVRMVVASDGKTARIRSVEEHLQYLFDIICATLWRYDDLVEELADRLERERRLSARCVAAICREYGKRKYHVR